MKTKNNSVACKHLSSFRDPSGHVFIAENRVFRGVSNKYMPILKKLMGSSFFKENLGARIVQSEFIDVDEVVKAGVSRSETARYSCWLEHERIEFISYPQDWPFEYLKSAALLQLDLMIEGLKCGVKIKDSSAYNIQFVNGQPVFIDLLSFDTYENGDVWIGYKQFCEHFLAPLCMEVYSNINFNQFFRASTSGCDLSTVSKILPFSTWLSPSIAGHIHIHAKLMQTSSSDKSGAKVNKKVSKEAYEAQLQSLKKFIKNLSPNHRSYWEKYSLVNTYNSADEIEKKKFIFDFVQSERIEVLLDLGCNSGEYSKVALEAGSIKVIGMDADVGALDKGVLWARENNKPIDFLFSDFMNPSSSSGWRNSERESILERLPSFDGVICLALIHHIVIANNVPMEQFLDWVLSFSLKGVIEFVSVEDPMVQGLLVGREGFCADYSEGLFIAMLGQRVNITSRLELNNGRTLFSYERKL